MVIRHQHCSVLVVASDEQRMLFRQAVATDPFREWHVLEARSFEQARFTLHHDGCEAVLLDGGFSSSEDSDRLLCLAARHKVPVVVLTVSERDTRRELWGSDTSALPLELSLRHPPLLHEALSQAVRCRDLQHSLRIATDDLRSCRERVSGLLSLLWEVVPGAGTAPWFSERYMLDRLKEEVDRANRYQSPLSLAIGEITVAAGARAGILERIVRGKRFSDIAGQYGPHGFLVLLPATPASGAVTCCRRLQGLLEEPSAVVLESSVSISSRICMGIASYSAVLASPVRLLARAEQCLEKAQAGDEASIVS
jgi:hypothetical protein